MYRADQASFARTNGSATQAPDIFRSFMQRINHMRDFRDAKAMAHTLRESLTAKSVTLTHSESLELIAKILGFHDWNVLSAKIQAEDKPAAGTGTGSAAASSAAARHEIAVNAATLDGYVGFYQPEHEAVFTVTREGHQLITRLTGQRSLPIFAESDTEFFARAVDAQISFITDAAGHATSLVLHQNGNNYPMQRIDAATAQLIEGKTAERVKDQIANPESEPALRRLIAGITSGKPNYAEMSATLADATRQQLPNLQASHQELGAIKSIQFLGVSRQGDDVYTVRHDNGASHWKIALDSRGLISTAWVTQGP
jgi:Glyoxalase superfamily protein/Domain of unknown function (DUF3471)